MNYYSQFGEDLWIRRNVPIPDKGFMVDIGSYDGITFSNSLHFEQSGWDGLLIEANPFIQNDRKWPTLNYAISKEINEDTEFYIEDDPMLSSFKPIGLSSQRIKVPTLRLDDLHIDHIDILSIDTEGTELEVWNTLTIRPTIIIIEYLSNGINNYDAIRWQAKLRGYRILHRTACNLILKK